MLDPHHHTALRIADQRWKYAAARAAAIRDQLGISETQWAQGARGAVCGAASHKTGLNRA